MQNPKDDVIRQAVRQRYGEIAEGDAAGCGSAPSSCCGSENDASPEDMGITLGYSSHEVSAVPQGANMSLGCGNPQAIAALRPGEKVLDLCSGGATVSWPPEPWARAGALSAWI